MRVVSFIAVGVLPSLTLGLARWTRLKGSFLTYDRSLDTTTDQIAWPSFCGADSPARKDGRCAKYRGDANYPGNDCGPPRGRYRYREIISYFGRISYDQAYTILQYTDKTSTNIAVSTLQIPHEKLSHRRHQPLQIRRLINCFEALFHLVALHF